VLGGDLTPTVPQTAVSPADYDAIALRVVAAPARPKDLLAELDPRAESLRGYLVVQVEVDDDGHRRTYLYRSAAAAERCVKRAQDRGRRAHVTLVQMMPVGVVTGLGEPR
jgi:hypothetical protein